VGALFGAAAAFLAYALFLQTAAVSTARLLAMLVLFVVASFAHYRLATRWLADPLGRPEAPRRIGLAVLLVALFFPLLYRPPAYPLSPLLRPWTDLAVQFEAPAGSQPLALAPDNVKLIMGKQVLNAGAFELAGAWHASGTQLELAPGATASLRWTGTLPETTVLSVRPPATGADLTVYWDGARTTLQLTPGQQAPVVINQKAPLPWGYNLAFLASCLVLAALAAAWLNVLFGARLALQRRIEALKAPAWAVVLLSIALAALTVGLQVKSLNGGLQHLTTTQLARHTAVLQGQAPDPWQYRVLSEYVAEGMLRLFQAFAIPGAVSAAFLSLRLLQNTAIFLAAFALYRKITGSNALALLALLLLTGSMLNAFYDNDLSFNTYFDLLFYLLCMLFVLGRKYQAVVILTVFAALNRETSGLIPLVMAGAIYGADTRPGLRKYMPVLFSLAIFIGVFAGLRLLFAPRPLYIPYRHAPGIPLLLYNLTRSFTWQQLLATLGLAPLVGLLFFSSWPALWQRLFVIICPLWFLVHSFASIMGETRLFLVPQAIIFIPGVLFALCTVLETGERPIIPHPEFERGAA
jgi:hypothetical protein